MIPEGVSGIRGRGALYLLLLLTLAACATSSGRSSRPEAFSHVLPQPGQVAWSPDSEALAVASGPDLVLADLKGESLQTVTGVHPVFLAWHAASGLVVVHRDAGGERRVSRWVPETGELQPGEGAAGARAAFPLGEGRRVVTLFLEFQKTSVGSFADTRLALVDEAGAHELGLIHSNLPAGAAEDAHLATWTFPGLRPFHETLIRPQYRKAPMFPPYILLDTLDPLTGEKTEIGRLNLNTYAVLLSWSPDGRFLAFADDDGYLALLDVSSGEEPVRVSSGVKGRYPSWHPKKKVIYFGGSLISPEGKVLENISGAGEESLGTWSPDGRHLALTDARGLRLLPEGPIPPEAGAWYLSPDMARAGDRLRTLKDLYRQKLISSDDYKTRREKHMKVLSP